MSTTATAPKSTTPVKAAKADKAQAPTRFCGCGCGLQVAGKSIFRQGHDARMVSLAVKATVNGSDLSIADTHVDTQDDIQAVIDEVGTVIESHFGRTLAVKYTNAAMNAWERSVTSQRAKAERAANKATREANKAAKAAKAPKASKPKGASAKAAKSAKDAEAREALTVKVGRWEYPAQRVADGTVVRNTKRDGSGEWVAV